MPPPELSLLLRLLELREDEEGRKEKNGESRKIRIRARQFITASFSFPPSAIIAALLSPSCSDVQMPNELVIKQRA